MEAGAVEITHATRSSRATAREAVTVVSLTKEGEEEAMGAGPVITAPVSLQNIQYVITQSHQKFSSSA